jgi:hypothetical protein
MLFLEGTLLDAHFGDLPDSPAMLNANAHKRRFGVEHLQIVFL